MGRLVGVVFFEGRLYVFVDFSGCSFFFFGGGIIKRMCREMGSVEDSF